jgi:hypothetical protein
VLLRRTQSRVLSRLSAIMTGLDPNPRTGQSSPSLILEEPMSTTSTAGPGGLGTAVQSRSLLQGSAAGAAAATLANAALWAGARAAGVSFMVSSAFMTQVGIVSLSSPRFSRLRSARAWSRWPLGVPAGRCAPSSPQPPWSPWVSVGAPLSCRAGHRDRRAAGDDAPGDRQPAPRSWLPPGGWSRQSPSPSSTARFDLETSGCG